MSVSFYSCRLHRKTPGKKKEKKEECVRKNPAVFRQETSLLFSGCFMARSFLGKLTNAPRSAEMTFACRQKRVTAKNTRHQIHLPKANATSSCKCQQANPLAGMLMGKVEPWSATAQDKLQEFKPRTFILQKTPNISFVLFGFFWESQ